MFQLLRFKGVYIFLLVALVVSVVTIAPKNFDESTANAALGNICSSTTLRTIPTDPKATGPWPVGSKAVTISGLSAEVWYPATPGSESGKAKDVFNMKDYLPELTGPVSEHNVPMNSYRDLPIDSAYGKYPVIIMVHGTASFKYAHHVNCAHWASRGFVVVSADNPNIYITDFLDNIAGMLFADQDGDTKDIISALKSPSGQIAFLNNRIDTNRIGLAGHSAGGGAVASLSGERGVLVIIPMAAGASVSSNLRIKSAMLMGGIEDNTASWSSVQSAYNSTRVRNKRLVGIPDAGHMVFTNICEQVLKAEDYGVDLSLMESVANDGCGDDYIDEQLGWEIVNYATTAVFEEILQCNSTSASSIDSITSKYRGVVYRD